MTPYFTPILPKTLIKASQGVLASWAAAGCTTVFDAGIGNIAGWGDFVITEAAVSSVPSPRFHGAVAIQLVGGIGPIIDILTPVPRHHGF
ncbi:hypothetical protein GJ744_001990 [Endocarpon pusillum]|uniref:Uncharacterized protein n=1 Tax=Endocarpon pusillum TaxID=364733 RepID=A0A8H7ACJ4_9EURO|nr:hypothetical protein GJ744_001990 [Endocarpon pusillum]